MDVVSTQRQIAPRGRQRGAIATTNGNDHISADTASPDKLSKTVGATTMNGNNGGRPRKSSVATLKKFRRARSAPPSSQRRRRLVEDHYRVDPEKKVLLPGLPAHDDDWARDSHDFFNLIVLVPVVVLNIMNWNWDILLDPYSKKTIPEAWTGDWFDIFFTVTLLYFLVDLLWVCLIPSCVKSPATIVKHHVVTLLYLLVPYLAPEYQWCMGACMSVELNTWFLIARRVFNKQGFPPWIIGLPPFFSIRIKLISIFFYLTWVIIRCILYPSLMIVFTKMWNELSEEVGTRWNVLLVTQILHPVFCLLNFKWSYDLLMSKIRAWRRKEESQISKGL